MRLFTTMLWISLKHSGRRLLCFFCFVLVGGLLAVAALNSEGANTAPRAVIGVVNLDENPIAGSALTMLSRTEGMEELFALEFLAPNAPHDGYAAVLTIPAGFTESVLSGENKPPLVELSAASPLEAMWARQMAQAGASYLTSAQLGIYAVLGRAEATLDAKQLNDLIMRVNLAFAGEFLGRNTNVTEVPVSASGALSLRQHYASALLAVLLLCSAFIYAPAVLAARRFLRQLRGDRCCAALFAAELVHLLLLGGLVLIPVLVLGGVSANNIAALLVLNLLCASFSLLVATLFQSEVLCTVASLLLGVGTGLLSGCIVPPALLPTQLAAVFPLLPAWQATQLLAVPFGGLLVSLWQPLLMAAVLLGFAALLWRMNGTREGGLAT